MKRFLLPILAALALPTAVTAEVTYLECNLDGYLGDIEITLNESKRKVTYLYGSGPAFTYTALFTKDKILFGGVRDITIDRTTGNIFLHSTDESSPIASKGKCKKVNKTKNLF